MSQPPRRSPPFRVAKAPRPTVPMVGSAGVRAGLELAAMGGGQLFEFSKASNLPLAFPASSANGQPIPRLLRPDVQLVHQAFGPAEHSRAYAAFTFAGAAGVPTTVLSETPANRVQYYQAFDAAHDDPIPRVIFIFLREVNTAISVLLQSTINDNPGAPTLAAGEQYCLRRPVWVPEGFALGASTNVIGAPNLITLRGVTVVVNPAETPPPLF